ncbi:MAG: NAD(P)-binding domain-containing protein [Flavitalea sp.]
MITFIGTGLLGANFTKALIKKGEKVRVWNRTFERAKALEADGAVAVQDIAEAVKGIDRIHITLSDDASVDAVLAQAKPGLSKGTILIDHTTTTEKGAVRRTAEFAKEGITYVHVPVFMGPSNALESTGVMLISGDQAVVEKVEPWIGLMTGKVLNFGDKTGKAAGIKLMGNLFLLTMTGGFSDMLALAKSLEIPSADLNTLFESWNPGSMAPARLKKITAGNFEDPSWELRMARKDARLMIEEAGNGGKTLNVIPSIAAQMDKWIEKGKGEKDWTIIASENL